MSEQYQPPSSEELADIAWQKMATAQGLTPSESAALQEHKGIAIAPTLPEPEAVRENPQTPEPPREVVREAVEAVMEDPGLTDLVTGRTILNLPTRQQQPGDNIQIRTSDLNDLQTKYRNGQSADITLFVHEIDRVLVPGFLRFFSEEEQAQFTYAPSELVQKAHQQFVRLILANRVNVAMEKYDRGIEAYIRPILPNVRSHVVRENIEAFLELWEANKQNPYRNLYQRTDRLVESEPDMHSEYAIPLLRLDPRYVSIGFNEQLGTHGQQAAFSDFGQAIFIPEPATNRECNLLEILSLLHEYTHKRFNVQLALRHGVESDLFKQSYAQVPLDTLVGIEEEDPLAIASEIEILYGIVGMGRHSPAEIAMRIGCNVQQDGGQISQLQSYAVTYFGNLRDLSAIPTEFATDVIDRYRNVHGVIIMRHDENGTLVPA